MTHEEKLRRIADRLVTTLGSMPADEADKVVFNVASYIYTELLDLDGEIIAVTDIMACSPGNKLQEICEYKFVEKN